jgi:DNA-binding MarR family transcriptional regulator
VCITPLGSELVVESLQAIATQKEKIFNILTQKEKKELNHILEKLTRSLYD